MGRLTNCSPQEPPQNHVNVCGFGHPAESPHVALAFPYGKKSFVSHPRLVTTARQERRLSADAAGNGACRGALDASFCSSTVEGRSTKYCHVDPRPWTFLVNSELACWQACYGRCAKSWTVPDRRIDVWANQTHKGASLTGLDSPLFGGTTISYLIMPDAPLRHLSTVIPLLLLESDSCYFVTFKTIRPAR